MSFDTTTIELCLSMYDWAKFRRTKGAIKLHLLLDHAGYLPKFVNVTPGEVHEVNVLRRISFDTGTVIVFDRGLVDFELWASWIKTDVFFVTRLKKNAAFEVVETFSIPHRTNLLSDQLIRLKVFNSKKKCPYTLRLVEVWDPVNEKVLQFVTNNIDLAAATIGEIYKERWQIELFFKALKQNLRIKTFIGTSFNAVMVQIWTALIAIMTLKYLQFKSKINWSLSNLSAMLRMNLLTYKDLWEWIDQPYFHPPEKQQLVQQSLAL